ncbi:MAG: Gfo/Idh/MocA family oxidoreductase [Planctomycetota bacterium]
MTNKFSRRNFLKTTAAGAIGSAATLKAKTGLGWIRRRGINEEPVVGYIGTGIRYHTALGKGGLKHGPCGGIADVDMLQLGRAIQVAIDMHRSEDRPINVRGFEDYRSLLDKKDIDVVFIASPDHWHSKQVIDCMRAGKDVYCEKPVTLTIREGEQIEKVMEETGRIIQVGTQQRTGFGQRFAKAAAIVQNNRLGKIKQVTVAIGGSRICEPLPEAAVPRELNWDLWLGQAPMTKYRSAAEIVDTKGWGAGHPFSRTHRYYRWFYEYSGGKLTDWGAHHIDIALLALGKLKDDIGPIQIQVEECTHPVEFNEQGMPMRDDQFNCATAFKVKLTFSDGLVMYVRHSAQEDLGFDNGIMFEGEKGRILVNRGKLVGRPVEELDKNPLPPDWYFQLMGQSLPKSHIDNFIDCVRDRKQPISDMKSHNLMLNVCHAINIAMRLNRKLTFDPKSRNFGSDELANSLVSREQRKGFEVIA